MNILGIHVGHDSNAPALATKIEWFLAPLTNTAAWTRRRSVSPVGGHESQNVAAETFKAYNQILSEAQ